mmetsp:Transcript_81818/g.205862  ORF Transcript_81818/g.205862 Transcript_81818/m.205862 type:complete len:284 (+) Transcript_81818:1254-2105(+)
MLRVTALLHQVVREAEYQAHEACKVESEHVLQEEGFHALLVLLCLVCGLHDLIPGLPEGLCELPLRLAQRRRHLLDRDTLDLRQLPIERTPEANLKQDLGLRDRLHERWLQEAHHLRVQRAPLRRARDRVACAVDAIVVLVDHLVERIEHAPDLMPPGGSEALVPGVGDGALQSGNHLSKPSHPAEDLVSAVGVRRGLEEVLGERLPERRHAVDQLLGRVPRVVQGPPRVRQECDHDAQETTCRNGDQAVDTDVPERLEILCKRAGEAGGTRLQEGHPKTRGI